MRGAGKDSASGRDLLYRYYGQLELLDLRFPVEERGVRVSFTWLVSPDLFIVIIIIYVLALYFLFFIYTKSDLLAAEGACVLKEHLILIPFG